MNRTILTGAGISFNKPSSFPLANVIIEQILNIVLPNGDVYKDILEIHYNNDKRISGDFVRFELLMELLVDIFDSNFNLIDFVDIYKEPNELHYIISQSAIDGNVLLTTNFDSLFEEAIIKLGKKPYTVCYESDYTNFDKIIKEGYVPVVKLHGSFRKYVGGKSELSKKTIQATLENVTSNMGVFLLANYKNDFLKKVSSSSELIVLGYSGCDDFDVVPSLRDIGFKKVTWISHSSNSEKEVITNNIVLSKKEELSPLDELFKYYYYAKKHSLKIVSQNTLSYLKNEFLATTFPKGNSIDGVRLFKEFISKWERKYVTTYKQYMIAGEIYNRISRKKNAIEYLKKALELCPKGLEDEIVRINLSIVNILNATSRFEESKKIIEPIIELANKNSISTKQSIIAFSHYGYLLFKLRELDKALHYKEKVLSKSTSKDLSFSQSLHDKALILYDKGKLEEALIIFSESIKICNSIGNISTATRGTYMLGCIYFDKGLFEEAINCYNQSEKLSEVINDFSHIGSCKHGLGQIKYLKGLIEDSLYDFKKSYLIDKEANYEDYLSVSWQHFGICYLELNKYSLAEYCFNKAIYWFKKFPDNAYVELLCYKALLVLDNSIDEALSQIEKAILYDEKEQKEKGEFYLRACSLKIFFLHIKDNSSFDFNEFEKIVEEINKRGLFYLLMEVLYFYTKLNMPHYSKLDTSVNVVSGKYKKLGNEKRYRIMNTWLTNSRSTNANILYK